uniref:Oxidation resistance protein 1 n=1 Tax=Aureoumbra lagunensis TaxID=44058 RepID=A0A7S3JQC0_9STRA|mmetsp:Transcript_68/g.120  ORF Transcript_68/g.120 Transcript_68/m.120 type:complete len:341 (-) Transcript_68:115-1137(-)
MSTSPKKSKRSGTCQSALERATMDEASETETEFSFASGNYYGGMNASSRRRHRKSKDRKKVKIARRMRKQLAKATGQHHVVSRLKQLIFGSAEEEPDFFEEADEDNEAETPLPIIALAPCEDEAILSKSERRAIVSQALPERLRSRRLFRRYAAHNDGYDLNSLSRICSDLENKPALLIIKTIDNMLFGTFIGAAPFGKLTQITSESSALSLEAAVFRLDLIEPQPLNRRELFAQRHAFRSQKNIFFEAPETFILALRTRNFLAIAADARTGGAALRLTASLDSGTSDASDLFKSPPLHKISSSSITEDASPAPSKTSHSSDDDRFEVADVEVYGFEFNF